MDIMRNQVIHPVAVEIVLFLSCINEFRDVVKSQAESLSAPSCMEVRLCVGQQLITFALASCRTRASRSGLPYAFCGAILCEVDKSTSSIVVPVDGPCFEYPEVPKSLNTVLDARFPPRMRHLRWRCGVNRCRPQRWPISSTQRARGRTGSRLLGPGPLCYGLASWRGYVRQTRQ